MLLEHFFIKHYEYHLLILLNLTKYLTRSNTGTTKEANDVFRECLAHINSVKLHIVFNKVDAFKSLEDFGKAHGTLYWNLSAAMQRKDVPIVCCALTLQDFHISHSIFFRYTTCFVPLRIPRRDLA